MRATLFWISLAGFQVSSSGVAEIALHPLCLCQILYPVQSPLVDLYRTRFGNLFSIHSTCLFDLEVLDEVLVIVTVSGTGIRGSSVLSTCRICGFLSANFRLLCSNLVSKVCGFDILFALVCFHDVDIESFLFSFGCFHQKLAVLVAIFSQGAGLPKYKFRSTQTTEKV